MRESDLTLFNSEYPEFLDENPLLKHVVSMFTEQETIQGLQDAQQKGKLLYTIAKKAFKNFLLVCIRF